MTLLESCENCGKIVINKAHRPLLFSYKVSNFTTNMTGETLVLNKNFTSIKQGFSQH